VPKSREIALRCAAALPHHLLNHRHTDHRRTDQATLHGVPEGKLPAPLVEQLMGCKDDAAQRIILGRSK
jgi:hypothetical protein